ncbi:hypothetical protein EVAR_62196_1 [Eumeta japonica]|uniref:HTH psq-type domain-containing protein n=1 Tax=Eumeta variegata TaxID=151549 RepID=A0A4C1Z4L8_EUMVA|nr:hypothetical protein EVAR_62196_1 [Eumeta japonica]
MVTRSVRGARRERSRRRVGIRILMLRPSPRSVVVYRRPHCILVPKRQSDLSRYKDAYEEVKAGDSLRKAADKHGINHCSLLRYLRKRLASSHIQRADPENSGFNAPVVNSELTKTAQVVCGRRLSSTRTRRRWSGREIDASQAERLDRSCLSIACSALSLARLAQPERDNESCFSCVQPAFINL